VNWKPIIQTCFDKWRGTDADYLFTYLIKMLEMGENENLESIPAHLEHM